MRFLGLLEHPSIFIYLIVNKIVRRVVAETFMGLICVCVILATWSAPAPSGPRTTLLLLLTLAQVRDLDYHAGTVKWMLRKNCVRVRWVGKYKYS